MNMQYAAAVVAHERAYRQHVPASPRPIQPRPETVDMLRSAANR